jgi:hypothetical protein
LSSGSTATLRASGTMSSSSSSTPPGLANTA